MKPQELLECSNDTRANHGGDKNGGVAAVGESCGCHVAPNDGVDGKVQMTRWRVGGEHDHVGTTYREIGGFDDDIVDVQTNVNVVTHEADEHKADERVAAEQSVLGHVQRDGSMGRNGKLHFSGTPQAFKSSNTNPRCTVIVFARLYVTNQSHSSCGSCPGSRPGIYFAGPVLRMVQHSPPLAGHHYLAVRPAS
jgi:hypothetical protein